MSEPKTVVNFAPQSDMLENAPMEGDVTESEALQGGSINLLRNSALQTSNSILSLQRRAEDELLEAKKALEARTEELANYLALLTATLESTADGIVALDLSGKVMDYNSKFAAIWHFPDDILQRRDSREMMAYAAVQAKDPEKFLSLIRQRQAEPEVEAFDVIELKDGRTLERYGFPQRVNQECVGVVVNFRDTTERKQAEQALAVFAAIVGSSHDAIVSKTLQGIITSWNCGAERIFGYSAAEAIGQSILIIIPPDRADEEPQILARQARGEGVDHFETVRVRKDGQRINVSITLSPIKDNQGKIIGISKIARDITQRKQADAEREDLLAREQKARLEAEAAARVKDEFLATLSHELRTPLSAILGWSSLINDGHLSDEQKARGFEVIHRSAKLQSQLIEDILDVSRIITGKLRLDVRPVELSSVIESAVESALPAAVAKDIRLQRVLDCDTSLVSGDPGRLQQVVWNLLANAIKFTPQGGRVQVRLEHIASHVEIIVADTGTGIPAHVLPHVFERFRQADQSKTRNYGGLGLGLAIVRHIVEMHGGSVEAQSPGEDQGATFTVKLPLMATHTFESGTPQSATAPREEPTQSTSDVGGSTHFECPSELEGLRVLVVDDDADALRLASTVLESCGAEVITANNAAEALQALQSSRPDVLISDLGMPGEDGYSLIRKVRALTAEQGGQTPAAALTAYARAEDRLQVLRSGFQIHLPKPIEPVELVAVVANLATRVGR
jgi:PAS domain S-box-containing protein